MSSHWKTVLGLALGVATVVLLLALALYEPRRAPPPSLWFDGVPARGGRADAQRAGFVNCIKGSPRWLRCERKGLVIQGQGPFSAAVDLLYNDGSGGFDGLVVWHDNDQRAVHSVGKLLKEQGWALCRTGPTEYRGDQEIYTRPGAAVRFSIDISYWGKRRLRILPEAGQPIGHCWSR